MNPKLLINVDNSQKIASFHSNAVLLHCQISTIAGVIYSILLFATYARRDCSWVCQRCGTSVPLKYHWSTHCIGDVDFLCIWAIFHITTHIMVLWNLSHSLHSYFRFSNSTSRWKTVNSNLYIKENRTPLSPQRPLIGASRDFTREHDTSLAWKWSRSGVDCGFLIKVTRENSD